MFIKYLAMVGIALSSLANAQELPLRKCRGITDAAARLACYDSIPAASAPDSDSAKNDFGLVSLDAEKRKEIIASSVGAEFDGWRSNGRILLENGQVWEVVDGSSGYVGPLNRKVIVRRAALGSFRMEFEGLNASPTVRRIK